jgi:hypothetical protein
MPEQAPDGTQPGGSTSTAPAADTFTPITSQEELDKAIGPRLERERSKFTDYETYKEKAGKYDQLEQDKATAAEAKVGDLPAEIAKTLRGHFVELYEIPAETVELYLTATDPELLIRQVNGLIERAGSATEAGRQNGNQVSREGTNPPPGGEDDPMRQFARGLFNRT